MIGGSAAKKYGGKTVLTMAVIMWSLSTFITPFFASSLYYLMLMRVILGIGEGIGKYLLCVHKGLSRIIYILTYEITSHNFSTPPLSLVMRSIFSADV